MGERSLCLILLSGLGGKTKGRHRDCVFGPTSAVQLLKLMSPFNEIVVDVAAPGSGI